MNALLLYYCSFYLMNIMFAMIGKIQVSPDSPPQVLVILPLIGVLLVLIKLSATACGPLTILLMFDDGNKLKLVDQWKTISFFY